MANIGRRNVALLLATLGIAGAGCEKRESGGGLGSASPSASPATPAPEGTPGVTADTIKIGSWGPLSGPAAPWGVVLQGMNAYFQHINASGGIHGRKVQFIYRDDQYSPAKTPAVVRELVEKEQVFAIVGGIGTANGRAVADYLEQKGVPFFTPSSGDRFWSEGGKKNIYTVFPKYVSEGEILGKYIAGELKAKKVGILYQDDDFGKQGLEGLKKGLAMVPGSEIVVEVTSQPIDTDMSGQASKVVEKKPDVLVLYAGPKQAVGLVKTLDAQKKKPQLVTSFVLSDPIMFKLAGESWEGAITSVASALPDSDNPSVAYYREILAKYGEGKLPVGNFTLSGFLYAIPLVEAMHMAGKDLTREKLYTALNSMKDWHGPALHWKGENMGAPLTFSNERRLGNEQLFLVKAKGGKWEKITDWLKPGS